MFEPFNKYKVKALSEMNYRLYIPHLNNNIKLKEKYYKILSGDIRNKWVDQYNKKYFCVNRIIKEIRINQSLKWIKINFPEIPIVYIVRHPCAVTLSKLRLNWDDHLFEYIGQIELVNDHLKPYIDIINSAKTAYEKHLIMWCIENSIVLNSFKKEEIFIIFYEYLITDPVKSIKKLYKYLNLNFNNKIIDTLSKPSLQANPQSAISRAKNIINEIDNMGGAIAAIEAGWIQNQIAHSAYEYQKKVDAADQIIVGINRFKEESKEGSQSHEIDSQAVNEQIKAVKKFKVDRDNNQVKTDLNKLISIAKDSNDNLLPSIIRCINSKCTLGEISDSLRSIFGEYNPSI